MGIGDLSGKTAVVTGANRGIGAAIAVALARAGADIVGTSRQMNADEEIAQEADQEQYKSPEQKQMEMQSQMQQSDEPAPEDVSQRPVGSSTSLMQQ